MPSISKRGRLAKLPTEELQRALREFLKPVLVQLREKRWREVAVLAAMARGGADQPARKQRCRVLPVAKRF
jgi:hypothetical protein